MKIAVPHVKETCPNRATPRFSPEINAIAHVGQLMVNLSTLLFVDICMEKLFSLSWLVVGSESPAFPCCVDNMEKGMYA